MKKEKESKLFSGEGNIAGFKVYLQSYGNKLSDFQNAFDDIEKNHKNKKLTFFSPDKAFENGKNNEIGIDNPSYKDIKSKTMQAYQAVSNNDKVYFFLLTITMNDSKKLPMVFLKKVYKSAAQKDPLNDNLLIDNISTIADEKDNIFYVFFTAQDEKAGYQASQLLRSITDLRFK